MQIRVFSAQRTHNSFSARFFCQDRTYQYFLPGKILGLDGETFIPLVLLNLLW